LIEIESPTKLHELFDRINQFLVTYGGKSVKSSDPRSLDMISDFLCVIGAQISLTIQPQAKKDLPEKPKSARKTSRQTIA
jgi:hypothetical protein